MTETATTRALFITGGAAGIGRATAERFARAGWAVGLCDIDGDAAQATARALGDHVSAARVDVSVPGAVDEALATFIARTGRLDAFFNNAGVLAMGPFHEMPVDKLLRVVDVNVRGLVLSARAALPHLVKHGGVLVQMGSASGLYGTANIAAYSASKFFVRGLTEALDLELAGAGVRVVDVMPSFVDTAMVRRDQHGSRTVEKQGVHLSADDIAALVWTAVTERAPLHVIPGAKMKLFARIASLSPALARWLAKAQT